MSSRDYFRAKLQKLLAGADREGFIQLMWATHALQSYYSETGRQHLRPETIPKGAEVADPSNHYLIHKWEIETLTNESLTTPRTKPTKIGKKRSLHCDHFGATVECARALRKVENGEYSLLKKNRESIHYELARIASRQFGWQRGVANVPQFYRNAFVYGQGECAAHFERKHGISINRFSMIGFMLFVLFTNFPAVEVEGALADFGVSDKELEKVLSIIALSYGDAARLAFASRRKVVHTADKPSVLRQFPCLRFGSQGERVRAPIPELILERITSGVFYDVVDGGGSVRDEYGKRFEEYCFSHLSDVLSGFGWEREFSYKKKPDTYVTSDILCSDADEVMVAIECKATRMSQEAMFGLRPAGDRGFEDLTKAVFQLWRFFSHCRRGHVGRKVSKVAVGMVLTLDHWLVLAEPMRKLVMEGAARMAAEKDADITDEDMRPIVFVAVSELEEVLSAATETLFSQTLAAAATEKFAGYRLNGVLREVLGGTKVVVRDYPYEPVLGKLLPWWDQIDDITAAVEAR